MAVMYYVIACRHCLPVFMKLWRSAKALIIVKGKPLLFEMLTFYMVLLFEFVYI